MAELPWLPDKLRLRESEAGASAKPAAAVMARFLPVLAWEAPDSIDSCVSLFFDDMARLRAVALLPADTVRGQPAREGSRPYSSTKGAA